jgi:PhzF family phenazine biosynthesis protein
MVFVNGPGGGNPVPLVAHAGAMRDSDMQALARRHGHESAFLLRPSDARAQWRLRFFVPKHEMEMCGHATVGTLWALRQWGWWTSPTAVVETASGLVDVAWDAQRGRVWVSQPRVRWSLPTPVHGQQVADVLGTGGDNVRVVNARTSRVKTLVALCSQPMLDALAPDAGQVQAVCEAMDSTGLYPFALLSADPAGVVLAARQFPKRSGYPEDAATGVAAAALWGYLQAEGTIPAGDKERPVVCTVRQGEAMGRPSAIEVKPRFDASGALEGCWLSGDVAWGCL